jgi:hypothetical protein
MANALLSAELKLVTELSKPEQAIEFVKNSKEIAKLKESLKFLETRNEQLEKVLIPEIGLKYQPMNQNFVLTVKTKETNPIPSYKDILEKVQDVFSFSEKDRAKVDSLIEANKSSKPITVKKSLVIGE